MSFKKEFIDRLKERALESPGEAIAFSLFGIAVSLLSVAILGLIILMVFN